MKKLERYLPEIIYGGNDGIITTFAVVSGFLGAGSSENAAFGSSLVVIIFGLANLFADATSMGLSNFLSERSKPIKAQKSSPSVNAFVTFIAFIIFGSVPLLPFLLLEPGSITNTLAVVGTFTSMFLLGVLKWKLSKTSFLKSVGEVLLVGSLAAGIAYFVGSLFKNI